MAFRGWQPAASQPGPSDRGPWTVDGHRVRGVDGVDRTLAAASHPYASTAFKGKLPEELKDKLQQELLPPRGGRQGLLLGAPLGPQRPQPPCHLGPALGAD